MIYWIILGVYLLIALGFFVAVLLEGRKYEYKFSFKHILVPLLWHVWLVWFIAVSIRDSVRAN